MTAAELIAPMSALQQEKDVSNSSAADTWEMVSPPPPPPTTQGVTFCPQAVANDEQKKNRSSPGINPKILKHSQSSPNLRNYEMVDDDDEDSMVMVVSETSSVWGGGSLSFRDAILKKQPKEGQQSQQHKKMIKKIKPKFVVTPIKRCAKSTGDLRALAHTHEDYEEILGESDAGCFYSQKAKGAKGRESGAKIRPDEQKRLDITMAKKNMQRQRQQMKR